MSVSASMGTESGMAIAIQAVPGFVLRLAFVGVCLGGGWPSLSHTICHLSSVPADSGC